MKVALLLAVLPATWLTGCGDDDYVGPYSFLVGGPCSAHADCAPGARCEEGGDFPQGLCTLPCDQSFDCPAGTACIDKEDGICMILCRSDFDCRGGYDCESKDVKDAPGEARVCSK